MYSVGVDKKLNVIDFNKKSIVVHIKTSNARLKALSLPQNSQKRLYASSYEG